MTLEVFHTDMSGKDINFLQLQNIKLILMIFNGIHFDISGKISNDKHLLNVLFALVIYSFS
jgi:hypothetical protein